MSKLVYYVGVKDQGRERGVFSRLRGLVVEDHEVVYNYDYVVGPHQLKLGAQYMAKYGRNNPHLMTALDADRMARRDLKAVRDGQPVPEMLQPFRK